MAHPRNVEDSFFFLSDYVNEASASKQVLEIVGAPTFDKGVTLDGASDQLNYTSGDAIRETVTLIGRAKQDAYANNEVIAEYFDGVTKFSVQTNTSGVGLKVTAGGTGDFATTGAIDTTTEFHFALVFDGTSFFGNSGRLKLYINGVEESLAFDGGATIPTSLELGGFLVVGALLFTPGNWDGDIKVIKASSLAFTAEEALDDYQNDTYSSLEANKSLIYCPMWAGYDDGSNLVIPNLGSLGNMILDGSNTPTKISGKVYGYLFDSNDDFYAPTTVTLDTANDYSAIIVFDKSTAGTSYYFDCRSSNQGVGVNSSTTSIRAFVDTGGGGKIVSGSMVVTDGRPHIAIINWKKNGANIDCEIWIDGTLDNSGTIDAFTAGAQTPHFGSFGSGANSINGGVYHCIFNEHSLTPRQIRNLTKTLLPTYYK